MKIQLRFRVHSNPGSPFTRKNKNRSIKKSGARKKNWITHWITIHIQYRKCPTVVYAEKKVTRIQILHPNISFDAINLHKSSLSFHLAQFCMRLGGTLETCSSPQLVLSAKITIQFFKFVWELSAKITDLVNCSCTPSSTKSKNRRSDDAFDPSETLCSSESIRVHRVLYGGVQSILRPLYSL